MNIKHIINGLLFAGALMFSGCSDFITVEPENDITFKSYFNTVKDAEALLNTVMNDIRTVGCGSTFAYAGWIVDTVQDQWVDDARQLEVDDNPTNWKGLYDIIKNANVIIDNIHRFPETVDAVPYLLQAYFAKAYVYFRIAQRWGECPIIKSTSDTEAKGKSSIPEVLEYTTECALKALDLPVFSELKDGNGEARTLKQYASKGAAAALLAHIYAWRAEIENRPEYWAEAEKYCTMIIDGKAGYYTLAADPEAVALNVMHRDDPESIYEMYRTPKETSTMNSAGNVYVGADFVKFPVREDMPVDDSWDYSVKIYKSTVRKMFRPEDKRRDAWFWGVTADSIYIVYNKATLKTTPVYTQKVDDKIICKKWDGTAHASVDKPVLLEEGDSIVENARYGADELKHAFVSKIRYPYFEEYKYSTSGIQFRSWDQNKVVWRLADIYLLRAEVRARQDARSSGAIADLNCIRERAYGNSQFNYPCADDVEKGLDKDLRLAIFREREKELMFEDHRYLDVVRNGRDYVRKELPQAFSYLTDKDIDDGALYLQVGRMAFESNELMRQNVYWNRRKQ
ncbi:RagB/SusD family nutrient uptake outer membrane protein [Butyricimonas synergistica]|uniref:RagB/SusD family nutrient uptake outer membrane protein n=1 Tax=Butyricimonas synergistica TaxID=544644 RepID=UPI000372859B|nr:RagB/SusD family nutrient uptake outer membrane protein [Butyricimonas synergistica]